MQEFKQYMNINNDIKPMDAVKITTIPQYESFWVEVIEVSNTGNIIGSVQNNLVREHSFNVNDIIEFNISNVKEHKKEEDRFIMNNISEEYAFRIYLANMLNMNVDEFDKSLNLNLIKKD